MPVTNVQVTYSISTRTLDFVVMHIRLEREREKNISLVQGQRTNCVYNIRIQNGSRKPACDTGVFCLSCVEEKKILNVYFHDDLLSFADRIAISIKTRGKSEFIDLHFEFFGIMYFILEEFTLKELFFR